MRTTSVIPSLLGLVAIAVLAAGHPVEPLGVALAAQTQGAPESFTAVAMVNNTVASGAGTIQIRITRWSTPSERTSLVQTLLSKGPSATLDELRRTRPVGTIKTPDSLGYDLHFASQTPGDDGGRRIVIATDRPIGFWEAANRPRTFDYPFTVIQMQMRADGKGSGTLSYATKVIAHDDTIELEHYASAPVMLTEITAEKP